MSSNYEILVEGKNNGLSVIMPVAGVRGLAVSSNTVAGDEQITVALSQANNPRYLGHLARAVTVAGGPTEHQLLFPDDLEYPDKIGRETTVEQPEIFSVEGTDYLEASTSPIDVNTALGSPITFKDGKLKVAVVGDYAHLTLLGRPTVVDSDNTIRVMVQKAHPYLIGDGSSGTSGTSGTDGTSGTSGA